MKKEVISAVNFLVDLLRVNNNNPLMTEDQLVKFRKNVYECLFIHYKDHWFPDKPMKGSGYRCIRINGKMDPLIGKAGELMGIAAEALRRLFPSELTMWVDPSEVAYRIGENGSICQLYVQQKSKVVAHHESSQEVQQQPQTPVRVAPSHHQSPSSPKLAIQQQPFLPSKSPPSPVKVRVESPRSPVFNAQQMRVQHQQLAAMFLMNSHNNNTAGNCKDSLRVSNNLESVRGIERLFVSS